MITPERAPVRPRVKRKGGDVSFLLEDEIAELVQQERHALVRLIGPPGNGKTTAVKHLAAVLAPSDAVMLLDPVESDPAHALTPMILAEHTLVVTTTPFVERNADIDLELVPWGRDEWIEYLLACHPAQCKSVMGRLLADDGNQAASYSAEIWRVVLEEMAGDESVSSPLDAMICRLSKRFTREQQLALSPTALDEMRIAQMIPWREALKVVPELDRPSWRLLNQPQVLSWIAAAYAARILKLALPKEDARCLENIAVLPRSYLYNLAALVRGDEQATSHVYRIAHSGMVGCHAAAVSVLHLAGVLPPPAVGSRPSVGGWSLVAAILEGVQWPGVLLDHMDLRGADFSGANLFQANLEGANADSAEFAQADLRQSSLREAKFVSANFAGANLSRAKALAANFTSADCSGSRFDDAYLCDATFQNANLTDARFRCAQLAEADLLGAVIDGADFTGAYLTGVNLSGRNFADAEFRDAIFTGATLFGCVLDRLELPGARFNEANLANATFTGASMPRAHFRGAILRGCGLADVDWEGADLRNADLRGAVFSMGGSRSGLVGSPYPGHGSRTGFYTDDYNDLSTHKHPEEIRKANLCGADLRGANIEGVDFYLVDLRGALYDADQAEQLRKCGAILKEPVA
ncbi:MAG TPA: pentapeptide repeat-containing protein [Pirellulaceae bacterium]|nr:pentapeptide repeat-containing protein [Pirellulaceae bacterium]